MGESPRGRAVRLGVRRLHLFPRRGPPSKPTYRAIDRTLAWSSPAGRRCTGWWEFGVS